ncbi:hypothetical protein, partial [Pseudomonas aeruginosa]|uniref:hypothetical protein n=1 Tax=Pseudomonas aeruginosa TaxID=287 RepID=UPI001ABC11EB
MPQSQPPPRLSLYLFLETPKPALIFLEGRVTTLAVDGYASEYHEQGEEDGCLNDKFTAHASTSFAFCCSGWKSPR